MPLAIVRAWFRLIQSLPSVRFGAAVLLTSEIIISLENDNCKYKMIIISDNYNYKVITDIV